MVCDSTQVGVQSTAILRILECTDGIKCMVCDSIQVGVQSTAILRILIVHMLPIILSAILYIQYRQDTQRCILLNSMVCFSAQLGFQCALYGSSQETDGLCHVHNIYLSGHVL